MKTMCYLAMGLFLFSPIGSRAAETIGLESRSFIVGNHKINASLARAPRQSFKLGVALAGKTVAANASLASIAKNSGALCVINGTFLAAYAGQTGEPYGSLNIDGHWLHLGSVGTRLDVLENGDLRLARDDLRVIGSIDGNPGAVRWYAYGLNQTPTNKNYSYVYTPERGPKLGFKPSLAVRVDNGVVVALEQNTDTAIPTNGFVIALGGSEVQQLGSRFAVGKTVEYRIESKTSLPSDNVRFSLGAGPKLLSEGAISIQAASEGFTGRVINERGTFSVVGWNEQEIFFVVVQNAVLQDGANILLQLGAREAMRLDGGASSGLYCNGKVVVKEARLVANGLVLWAN